MPDDTVDGIELLSAPEAAARLRVSKRKLYFLTEDGGLSYVMLGKVRRWRSDHLREYIERNTTAAA